MILAILVTFYRFVLFCCLVEKIKLAVPAAAAVLLLNPSDENARHNMEYYHTVEDEYHLSTSVHFQPRQDASDFHHKKEMLEKLLRTSEVDLIDNDEVSTFRSELSHGLRFLNYQSMSTRL